MARKYGASLCGPDPGAKKLGQDAATACAGSQGPRSGSGVSTSACSTPRTCCRPGTLCASHRPAISSAASARWKTSPAEREKVVPQASGIVLEIGIGPGLNLPYYDPARVTRVIGVDPHRRVSRLGHKRQRQLSGAGGDHARACRGAAVGRRIDRYGGDHLHPMLGRRSHGGAAEVRRVLKPRGRVLFLEHGLSTTSVALPGSAGSTRSGAGSRSAAT